MKIKASSSAKQTHKDKTFFHHHHTLQIPLCTSQHRWVPHWCLFHLSKFWLISQLHYTCAYLRSSTQHSSLCVNGLSASLRLRVQLRGESLICHLTVLFLSCCVIIPEADGQVKNAIYLKEATMNSSEKERYFFCGRLTYNIIRIVF